MTVAYHATPKHGLTFGDRFVYGDFFDVPLAYAGTYPSLRVRRAIQYSKGAVFLDHLRERMGDAAFWKGIKAFTVRYAGGTVTSANFQHAMQAAAATDLGPMFREWVGGEQG